MPLTIPESPMKITGARNEPIRPERRRVAAPGLAAPVASGGPVDEVSFLGIPRGEMTPAVQAAIEALIGELDGLKREVGALRARLTEAEGLADRDALTPLLNRRAFVRELARARTFAQRYGSPASLVYFDLDGFKALNDRLGHAAGDAALQAVADRLAANVRESDVVGRMGGDEFAVVLVQADRATAEAKAAALAAAIEDPAIGLRASYGVREIAADIDPETLIADADAAMFAAKRVRRAG
jgi:diguanylate cyclase (GGDEF)-like protein